MDKGSEFESPRFQHYQFAYVVAPQLLWSESGASMLLLDLQQAEATLIQIWQEMRDSIPTELQVLSDDLELTAYKVGGEVLVVLLRMPAPEARTEAHYCAFWFGDRPRFFVVSHPLMLDSVAWPIREVTEEVNRRFGAVFETPTPESFLTQLCEELKVEADIVQVTREELAELAHCRLVTQEAARQTLGVVEIEGDLDQELGPLQATFRASKGNAIAAQILGAILIALSALFIGGFVIDLFQADLFSIIFVPILCLVGLAGGAMLFRYGIRLLRQTIHIRELGLCRTRGRRAWAYPWSHLAVIARVIDQEKSVALMNVPGAPKRDAVTYRILGRDGSEWIFDANDIGDLGGFGRQLEKAARENSIEFREIAG